MQRIEINAETGEKTVIELSPLEVIQAKQIYDAWVIEQEKLKLSEKERLQQQLIDIQSQLDALK